MYSQREIFLAQGLWLNLTEAYNVSRCLVRQAVTHKGKSVVYCKDIFKSILCVKYLQTERQ